VLDFTELPQDGVDFERLVREMLFVLGHRAYWSGRGPDGGRDLFCVEERPSAFYGKRLAYETELLLEQYYREIIDSIQTGPLR
jgi:hypothetical protein